MVLRNENTLNAAKAAMAYAASEKPRALDSRSLTDAKGLFSKTKNNRSENIGLVSWCDSDISAGGGTKKGRMKSRQTVAKRYVSYFFVSFNYTPEFIGFKYQAAGLPAVA